MGFDNAEQWVKEHPFTDADCPPEWAIREFDLSPPLKLVPPPPASMIERPCYQMFCEACRPNTLALARRMGTAAVDQDEVTCHIVQLERHRYIRPHHVITFFYYGTCQNCAITWWTMIDVAERAYHALRRLR